MQEFVVGQRWISAAELHLGLGMVIEIEHRTVSIVFPATGETRIYARGDAPLTRVRFRIGDTVERQDGQVLKVEALNESAGLISYHCIDVDGAELDLPEGRLSNYLQFNQPAERLLNAQIDRNKWFSLRRLTREHANRLQRSPVFGLAGSRTSLLAHQMYIAHEVSRRYAPRVLLADEVGLGKTIEAGLILNRCLLTERASRVLIVVPESLLHQWLVEMLRRFNLLFSIFDAARLDHPDPEDLAPEAGDNPFFGEQLVLCSLDFLLANPQLGAQAADGEWDMLVVDEAHHLSWSPESVSPAYQLVENLAASTAGLLLLTATPEQLGKESHFARLRLLDPDRYTSLDHFIAGEHGYRELAAEAETLIDDPERADELDDLLDRHGTGRVLFRNTRHVVQGFPRREVHPIALRPSDDQDPRFAWLGDFLRDRRDRKLLIIVAGADDATTLAEALKRETGARAALFHERMTLIERDRAAAWFADTDDGAQLLVCSEIGSEGRNFQFAHHLVMYDLPANPDLVEQRIGRLDRIGQNAAIHIHLPYLLGGAEEVLLRWYHEGLDALSGPCPAGHGVWLQTRQQLAQLLENPDSSVDEFIASTAEMRQRLEAELLDGRDRLLEINSCRPAIADQLVDAAIERDREMNLFGYMEWIYDCYGVNSDIRGRDGWVIAPGDNMLTQMPGLPEDGMTVTYDRSAALANEDLQFLTWEHPLVQGAMELILTSEFGNTALIARQCPGIAAGTLLAECDFLVDFSDEQRRHNERFFPNTTIRVVVDEAGDTINREIDQAAGAGPPQRVDSDTAIKVVKARQAELTAMLAQAEAIAGARLPALVDVARANGRELLGHEIDRLQALRLVNPAIRSEEIEFFQGQLDHFEAALERARPRLDAVRVVVTL